MSRWVFAIVAGLTGLMSVSLATCTVISPAGRTLKTHAVSPDESVQTGFGDFARAGLADNMPDPRRKTVSAASGGQPYLAVFDDITRVAVDSQLLPKSLLTPGQGAQQVSLSYWNARGMRVSWDEGPVTVSYTLSAGDGSRELSGDGAVITQGSATLAYPGSTFRVNYPLPDQASPTSFGILRGSVRLPNGRSFDFREKVVRRSAWQP